MTRARCGGFGYWASTKGGRLNVYDFMGLHGFEREDLPMKTIGVTEQAMATAMGNAQSLNVEMAILPKILFLSGLITKGEHKNMTRPV